SRLYAAADARQSAGLDPLRGTNEKIPSVHPRPAWIGCTGMFRDAYQHYQSAGLCVSDTCNRHADPTTNAAVYSWLSDTDSIPDRTATTDSDALRNASTRCVLSWRRGVYPQPTVGALSADERVRGQHVRWKNRRRLGDRNQEPEWWRV